MSPLNALRLIRVELVVREIGFQMGLEIPPVTDTGRVVSLLPVRGKLRDSNSGHNTDNGNNDHQLDQGKTFSVEAQHDPLLQACKLSFGGY
jgi:hypothetical protein